MPLFVLDAPDQPQSPGQNYSNIILKRKCDCQADSLLKLYINSQDLNLEDTKKQSLLAKANCYTLNSAQLVGVNSNACCMIVYQIC